jgi:hypothetical protein
MPTFMTLAKEILRVFIQEPLLKYEKLSSFMIVTNKLVVWFYKIERPASPASRFIKKAREKNYG